MMVFRMLNCCESVHDCYEVSGNRIVLTILYYAQYVMYGNLCIHNLADGHPSYTRICVYTQILGLSLCMYIHSLCIPVCSNGAFRNT